MEWHLQIVAEERPPATGLCTPAPGLCTPAPGLRTSAGAPPAIRAAPAPSIAPAAAAALLLKVPTVAQNPEFLKELEKVVGETITRLRKEVGEKEEEIEKKQKMLADVKGELALFEAMEVAHWI